MEGPDVSVRTAGNGLVDKGWEGSCVSAWPCLNVWPPNERTPYAAPGCKKGAKGV